MSLSFNTSGPCIPAEAAIRARRMLRPVRDAALEDIRQAFYSGTFQQTLGAFPKGSSTLTTTHKATLKAITSTLSPPACDRR